MYVRLGFAVAIFSNPDIVLVDEVLSVGDAAFRRRALEALRSLIDQGAAALARARDRGLIRAGVPLPELVWWFIGQMQGRRLVEQTDAAVDHEAWVGLATTALLTLLFDR